MKDVNALIAAWMSDEATPEEVQALFEWVREDPNHARQFARETALHSDLSTYFSTARNLQEVGEEPFVVEPVDAPATRPSYRRQWQISAAIAACVLLFVGVGLLLVHVDNRGNGSGNTIALETEGRSVPFVTVAQLENAQWDRESPLETGDRLATETLVLRSGMAKLLFDDGVEVTLSGPARYRLISKGSTNLTGGLLTATVPPGAEYFRVETPSSEIFDLGTAFGVNVAESGDSRVSVFDGAVQVFPLTGGTGQMLTAGAEAFVAVGGDVETGEFDSQPFEQLWPVASGIAAVEGTVRYSPFWDQDPAADRDDGGEIFIRPEGYATILSRPLDVDIQTAGEYSQMSRLNQSTLSAGTRLRSFLLSFDSQTDNGRLRRVTGAVTFNRNVVGIVATEEHLRSSADRLSPETVSLSSKALELSEDQLGDAVTLSADLRTVSLDLLGGNRDVGQIRVLVDDSYSEVEESRLALTHVGATDGGGGAAATGKLEPHRGNASAPFRESEFPQPHRPRMHPMARRLFGAHDSNRDGKVSVEEVPPHMRRLIERFDINGDGSVTPFEMSRSPMAPAGPHPHPGPGPHPGPPPEM